MSAAVRIAAALPDDEESNALEAVLDDVLAAPLRPLVIVAEVRVDKITRDIRTGANVATLRYSHIEVMHGDNTGAARELMDEALEDRLGVRRLPFPELADVTEEDTP